MTKMGMKIGVMTAVVAGVGSIYLAKKFREECVQIEEIDIDVT